MALRNDVYKVLKSIVGQENISEDPAVLDGYAWQWIIELAGPETIEFGLKTFKPSDALEITDKEMKLATALKLGSRFGVRPVAVILPANTEEVQALVKACNRYGLKYKAHSTGWGAFGSPGTMGVLQIDLRRMNKILEINEEDMYAVVEPYVVWGTLQAETQKRGLNCVTIGAGSNCSALASITSMQGLGYNNYSMGMNERNVLGVEWVLPDGQILRLGSLGSGAGWISGDGPGPSLRGIMRGLLGAMGGLGVFTKCAAKLYHWGGPAQMPVKNIEPNRTRLEEYPENMAIYYPYFETHEQRDEALWRLGENEIGYTAAFMGRGMLAWGLGGSNLEASVAREGLAESLPEIYFMLLLVCNSRREFEYQKKVVEKIIAETGGKNLVFIEQPELRDMATLLLTKGGNKANIVFQRSGAFVNIGEFTGSRRTFSVAEKLGIEIKKKYVKKGVIVDDFGEGSWGSAIDYSHITSCENETLYDPVNPESCEGVFEEMKETGEVLFEHKLPEVFHQRFIAMRQGKSGPDVLGPSMSNYHIWQRKIKRAFDPNDVSDSTLYILSEEPEKE